MIQQVFRCSSLAACLIIASAVTATAIDLPPGVIGSPGNASALPFVANQGQWPDSILFQTQASGAAVWFTTDGAYYQFTRPIPNDPTLDNDEPARSETIMIKAELVGGNRDARTVGLEQTDYRCNYFLGSDPAEWQADVPTYRAIALENVYPGIDLVYYGTGRRMEYDFQVAAGADHTQIRIQYLGANGLTLAADGSLRVSTDWGELKELAPVVYQMVDGVRKPVSAVYRLMSDDTFRFDLGPEFDPAQPVVIDPVLVYSTYLGGDDNEGGRGLTVDGTGSAYITGETFSANFPTLNEVDGSRDGSFDAFVSKLNAAGNGLIYSTYIGGSVADGGYAVAVDDEGSAFVTGFTSSTDFPTVNPFQSQFAGQPFDAFVVKLAPLGNALTYATYLGGTLGDNADGIAVDASGAAYLTGYTASSDFPTDGPYQAAHGGEHDAFITKLSASGSSLVYSTYLGGSKLDDGNDIVVDGSGSAYITGWTRSDDFPTSNAFQPALQSLLRDAFVAKLSANGRNLSYSTYLGGALDEQAFGIAVDASGAAYVAGKTLSSDYPTFNPVQTTNQGEYDAFITKLASNGNSLEYSTYFGGAADDYAFGVGIDASGSAYMTGQTLSSDFPVSNAYQATFQGGASDAFVTRMTAAGDGISYSTFFGGSGFELSNDMVVTATGQVFLTGLTDSPDFPTRLPYQEMMQMDGADIFVTMIADSLGPDFDSDGIPDIADNCPQVANVLQVDNNGDGTGDACCCVGRVGDANNNGDDEPSIGDVSLLIEAKFIVGSCVGLIDCLTEADVNQSGGIEPTCEDVTIGDISALIDYLFIAGPSAATLSDCL